MSCQLKSVPDSFGSLEGLEELLLAGNTELRHLCEALSRLSRLAKLDISSCSLAELPDSLAYLDMLTVLNLSDNRLQKYPMCTVRLKSLRLLDLSTSDSCSVEHENTGSADLKGNRIKELPVELAYSNLLELKLSGNPITEPPVEIWTNGLETIKSFMRAVIPNGHLLLEDTINVVGGAGACKTSVAFSLIAQSPVLTCGDERTHVMQQFHMIVDESSGQSVIINDFSCSEAYCSIIPTFFPARGLFILVFDMTDETQELSVKRWLLTLLAKSSDVRIIIVGTHADMLAKESCLTLEKRMGELLSKVLKCAVAHIEAQIRHLESRQNHICLDKLRELERCHLDLQRAKIRVVTLSCAGPGGGLARLSHLVVTALRPPAHLPARWCRFTNEILRQDTNFITREQVELIAKALFVDEYECGTIELILRYLAKTSQILWFDDHPRLRKFIFHSPQKIMNTCEKILHPHEKSLFGSIYKSEIEQYKSGLLCEKLLRELVSVHDEPLNRIQEHAVPSSQNFEVIVDFMQQFNIMSCVTTNVRDRKFVVPCKLHSDAPSSFQKYTQIGENCVNRVTVKLSFLLSVVPFSFFETSLSSMLTIAMEFDRTCLETWRNGLIFVSGGVHFLATLRNNVITLTAFSEPPAASPWTVLRPILTRLNDNSAMSWVGVQPQCAIECPWCARYASDCQSDDPKSTVSMIEVDLRSLASCERKNDARLVCSHCMKMIPLSLCFPTTAYDLSSEEQSEILEFFKNSERQCQKSTESEISRKRKITGGLDNFPVGADSKLVDRLRTNMSRLICDLTEVTVLIIAIDLYTADIIAQDEMKLIQSETTSRGMASALLDTVRSREDAAIKQLILSLRSERVARPDLADLLDEHSTASGQDDAGPVALQ